MKRFVAVLIITLAATSLLAQTPAAASQPAGSDPVVVRFGTTEIHASELDAALQTLPEDQRAFAAGPGRKAFAEQYAKIRVLAADARKNGLDKDPAVMAQLRILEDQVLANARVENMFESIKATDAELQKQFDANKSKYEMATARHILISFKGSPVPLPEGKQELTEEQAKAKAEEIRKKLVAGADFATVAKAESYDTGSGSQGGSLGSFGRDQMVEEFATAAFEGKVGEIQPLVRTRFGYHIIQVQERKLQSLAEVREGLEQEFKRSRIQDLITASEKAANVTYDEKYFAPPAPPAAPPVAPPAPAADKKQ